MDLPRYQQFTPEQRAKFGPPRAAQVLDCEHHVYLSPFIYDNVEVSDFYEIDPGKGIEFKADTGRLTINSEKPITTVTVVGSACYSHGYNICEWWDPGQNIDNLKDQLVKRQRVDNLHGIHPSIFFQIMLQTFPGLTYKDIDLGITDPVDCIKKFSEQYYESVHLGFYENTARFRIGPPYPNAVTIRSGCKLPEVPGLDDMQPKADYAIRVVDLTVMR